MNIIVYCRSIWCNVGGTVDIVYVDKGKNKLTTDTVQAISTALVTVAGGLTGDRATGACTAQMGTEWYRWLIWEILKYGLRLVY